jgi:protoporphyrinogen oxidase
MKNAAVIGAGVGGMAAAYDLAKAGKQVTIFEKESAPGGLASGFREEGWKWSLEIYYHHWFSSDHFMLSLIEELGFKDKIRFFHPKTVVYYQGDFYPLDSPIAALLFPGFSLMDKMRFGFVSVYLRYFSSWRPLEAFSAHEWMLKYYGEKVYKTLFEPLLIGKFSQYYKEVNMAWFWARFKARTPSLGTYEGGFQAFLDDFAGKLKSMGVRFQFNTAIDSISPAADGKVCLKAGTKDLLFDQVLATLPPNLLAKTAPALSKEYLDQLNSLKSLGAVVLILALKRQFSSKGYYWFNLPKTDGFPFLALVEHTNFVSAENFGGDHLIYCGDYLDSTHEYFSLTREELIKRFMPSLKRINPDFDESWIKASWKFSTPFAQPVPLVNHSKNIPSIKTPIDNLYFAGMSQVYPWDRGTNFAVELGRQAAKEMNFSPN